MSEPVTSFDHAEVRRRVGDASWEFAQMTGEPFPPEHTFSNDPIVIELTFADLYPGEKQEPEEMHRHLWTFQGEKVVESGKTLDTWHCYRCSKSITTNGPAKCLPAEYDEPAPEDAAIRADCELLWDFMAAQAGIGLWSGASNRRRDILQFVCERRSVEWPAWASDWIAGTEAR